MIRLSDESIELIWMATGGALLVLLRSIIDGTRRNWQTLVVGVLLGAAASAIAGQVFHGSTYVFPICGAAAVVSENVILGLFNVSKEFSNEPLRVFSTLWQLIVPSFGRQTGMVSATVDGPAQSD